MRWLADPRHAGLSDYMLASEARRVMDEVTPELRYAGIAIPESRATGSDYWSDFVEAVRSVVAALA